MDCTHFVTFLLCSKPFELGCTHPSVINITLDRGPVRETA